VAERFDGLVPAVPPPLSAGLVEGIHAEARLEAERLWARMRGL